MLVRGSEVSGERTSALRRRGGRTSHRARALHAVLFRRQGRRGRGGGSVSDGEVLDLDRPRREATVKVRPLLRVENLAKFFPIQRGFFGRPSFLRAVDGVSLHVRRAETL